MSYMVLKKKHIIMVATGILSLILLIFFVLRGEDSAVAEASAAKRQLPIYSVEKTEKIVSISFDAAWGNEDTQELIDILAKYDIKATFFVVGDWVDKYPESVKALFDAGHEIQNHSNTHPDLTNLSREQIAEQITSCNEKIKSVTGVSPTLIRPPYGAYNNTVIETVTSLGMYTIQWDVDSLDWKDLSAEQIYNRVTSKVKPGSIVLFHNAALHTPEALPDIIETLQSDGYDFVKISDLIIKKDYTIDHAGKQRPSSSKAITSSGVTKK